MSAKPASAFARSIWTTVIAMTTTLVTGLHAAPALTIVANGQTAATICVDAEAGAETGEVDRRKQPILARALERQAADDLAHYVELMSGAKPEILTDPARIRTALNGDAPVFVIGDLALRAEPSLRERLNKVAHPAKVGI